jgi:glycerol-3-phosphate dehydrogenase
MYNVIIIGAGIVGASIARELSKYNLKVCVLEKEIDVSMGTTKANSAIVHAGFDAKPNTIKAKLNVMGNNMFDVLSKELDFPFKRNGSLVLCFNENDMDKLLTLKEQGEENGVPDLEILNGDNVRVMEPNLSENVVAALYAPTGGIVCPYEMTIALSENAYENGVEFFFENQVLDITAFNDNFRVITNKSEYVGEIIINAAGLFSDDINNMVSSENLKIIPRRGEYCVFDKSVGNMISKTIFQLPSKLGKGVLVAPTVDGNLIIGPNAVDQEDKEGLGTTFEGLENILKIASMSIKNIPRNFIINSFSGLRARTERDDFIIEQPKDAEGFINVAGIESPGLTSAPAIARIVSEMVIEKLKAEIKPSYNPIRKGIPKFREMSLIELQGKIRENPKYGNIVCRCETVSEGEIIDAIHRPIGAKTLDGVKIRTRAGMGRCQSGFCASRILNILSRELELEQMKITKFGRASHILICKNKEFI